MSLLQDINEDKVQAAFTAQSVVFDTLYGNDRMIAYKRSRVRNHISGYLQKGSHMLELNCGTGEDALYFAKLGFKVHATDVSAGMLDQLICKKSGTPLDEPVTTEQCSFTNLSSLKRKGPYDYVYSNFGGLNCTGKLDTVLTEVIPLVAPGGFLTLVIISKFSLWESMLVFKGRFRTAFRRFCSADGRRAQVEGNKFKCWYYNPSAVTGALENHFDCIATEGLCTIVPPSYIAGFPEKYPRLFDYLCGQEDKWKASFPWRYMGDYFIITLQKKQ